MKAVVGTKTECDDLLAKVNASLGYPRDGVDLPGGIHAASDVSRTVRAVDLVQHPTLPSQWALPTDDVAVKNAPDVKLAVVVDLTPDWIPTPAPIGSVAVAVVADEP